MQGGGAGSNENWKFICNTSMRIITSKVMRSYTQLSFDRVLVKHIKLFINYFVLHYYKKWYGVIFVVLFSLQTFRIR